MLVLINLKAFGISSYALLQSATVDVVGFGICHLSPACRQAGLEFDEDWITPLA